MVHLGLQLDELADDEQQHIFVSDELAEFLASGSKPHLRVEIIANGPCIAPYERVASRLIGSILINRPARIHKNSLLNLCYAH
ncbi:MAG: hypothetical protein GY820_32335 [Gammaproteobacteria bacterium]|nr:hypothetical protein [Gammaproteobacteria bacterium]